MKLLIKNMNKQLAKDILEWKYDAPYDFYNNELTDEGMEELLSGSYFALFDEAGELFGFFCIGKSAQVPAGHQYGAYPDGFVDMGLGMHPNRVGQGNGFRFCSFILQYIKESFPNKPVRLTVAKFNKRAIHLYEKLGFIMKDEFDTDYGAFITMEKMK